MPMSANSAQQFPAELSARPSPALPNGAEMFRNQLRQILHFLPESSPAVFESQPSPHHGLLSTSSTAEVPATVSSKEFHFCQQSPRRKRSFSPIIFVAIQRSQCVSSEKFRQIVSKVINHCLKNM
ncbi:hypothetical protein AVEN_174720-1 [Araneus ventricosus]|uniref:Uncharacterized protein n=1 Tax=Araneus ventricosus TaxID=182803 RepID=A0A4Y2BL47_ARAVE|nr:hypothetical protein AVEN_174720-1 [Araneus ventricosus]